MSEDCCVIPGKECFYKSKLLSSLKEYFKIYLQHGRMIHFAILTIKLSLPGISAMRMGKRLDVSQGSRILVEPSPHHSDFVYIDKCPVL